MKKILKTDYELLEEELRSNYEEIEEIDDDLDRCNCMSKYGRAQELEERNKEIYDQMEKIKKSDIYTIY